MIVIDPGKSGGIVAHHPELNIGPTAFAMPKTDREICDRLVPNMCSINVAYIEALVKYAGRNMPSSSMAVYSGNEAFIRGVLTAFGYKIIIVPPKAWQKALGLGSAKGMTKTQWKNKLKQRAEQLFPQIGVTLATADALLIYEAASRGLIG